MAQKPQQSPQTVLITGAEGALGAYVTHRFLKAGCQVVATYRSAKGQGADSRLAWLQMDVTDPKSVHAGFGQLRAGGIEPDCVVHCAGGFRFSELESTSLEDLEFLLNVNLRSAFLVLREALPSMKKSGFGRIVLVSARATLDPTGGMSAYLASKAGINALVGSLSKELREFDINVNAVLPTVIDTPANREAMPQANFRHWVSPEDLAETIFSLTQPQSRAVNGALVAVSGRL